MEELSSYYKELSLLQVKYEHLAGTCRTLLKSWPLTEKQEEKKRQELVTPSTEDHSKPLSQELDQLDALLKKAQKTLSHKKEEPLTKKSMKVASNVYKNKTTVGVQNSNREESRSKSSGSKARLTQIGPGTKSRLNSKSNTTEQRRSFIVLDSKRDTPRSGSHAQRSLSSSDEQSHQSLSSAQSGCCVDQETDEQGFSLLKNGKKLSMPSKYHKFKTSLCKCSELLVEDEVNKVSKAAATHFSKRLEAKRSPGCSERIQLQLATKEIGIIIEKMMSMTTPGEWTVCERGSWQDILRAKTKLDLLMQVYQSPPGHRTSRTKTPLSIPGQDSYGTSQIKIPLSVPGQDGHWTSHTKTPLSTPGQDESTIKDTLTLAYSSMKDWNELSTLEMQRKFKHWETQYLAEVREILIGLASQFMSGNPSSGSDKHSRVSVLQALYLASNISTNPVYLDTENMAT